MALEFVIQLISNNEVILKKLGEKINLMDEISFSTLNEMIETEVEKNHEFEREEGEEEKGEKFYYVVKNLMSKKKRTWLEVKPHKTDERTMDNSLKTSVIKEELVLEKKKSLNSKDLVIQAYRVQEKKKSILIFLVY